jgi:hypothetical protein
LKQGWVTTVVEHAHRCGAGSSGGPPPRTIGVSPPPDPVGASFSSWSLHAAIRGEAMTGSLTGCPPGQTRAMKTHCET